MRDAYRCGLPPLSLSAALLLLLRGFFQQLGQFRVDSHKTQVYDHVTMPPAMVRGPGIPAGVEHRFVTSMADFAPTILELAAGPSAVPRWVAQSFSRCNDQNQSIYHNSVYYITLYSAISSIDDGPISKRLTGLQHDGWIELREDAHRLRRRGASSRFPRRHPFSRTKLKHHCARTGDHPVEGQRADRVPSPYTIM